MASPLTVSGVVIETHRLRQPVKLNSEGQPTPITLPERVAKMYLEMRGECNLPALTGIATTPCFQRVELFGTSLDMTGKVGFGVPRCRR